MNVDKNKSGSSTKIELDLDSTFNFSSIKYLTRYDNSFFLLSNRLNGKLGNYLFEIPCKLEDKSKTEQLNYILR